MKRPFLILPLLAAACAFCGFQFLPGGDAGDGVTGRIRLEPSSLVVGEPFSFVVELEVPEGSGVEGLQFGGLPDPSSVPVEFGDVENLTDGTAPKGKILKRFRLPGRFTAPFNGEFHPVAAGMAVRRRQSSGFSFSSSSSFQTRLGTVRVAVAPLPEAGRPVDFSGAVGRDFRMTQTVAPDHVHPGDLVTASYVLTFDGYCPSNAVPRIEHLPRAFKAYVSQESERKARCVAWTQVLVPQTTAATNTALVSLNYYNVENRRYEVAMAAPRPLVFISAEAASTTNTVVAVDAIPAAGPHAAPGSAPSGLLVLRFGPSERSPVVLTLPSGAVSVRETARDGAWRRLETPRGTGWTR